MVSNTQPHKQLQPILESIHFISLLCQEQWLPPFLSRLTWTMLFSINSHEREVVACSCCNNLEHNRQCRDTCELFHRKTQAGKRRSTDRHAFAQKVQLGIGVPMSFQASFIFTAADIVKVLYYPHWFYILNAMLLWAVHSTLPCHTWKITLCSLSLSNSVELLFIWN